MHYTYINTSRIICLVLLFFAPITNSFSIDYSLLNIETAISTYQQANKGSSTSLAAFWVPEISIGDHVFFNIHLGYIPQKYNGKDETISTTHTGASLGYYINKQYGVAFLYGKDKWQGIGELTKQGLGFYYKPTHSITKRKRLNSYFTHVYQLENNVETVYALLFGIRFDFGASAGVIDNNEQPRPRDEPANYPLTFLGDRIKSSVSLFPHEQIQFEKRSSVIMHDSYSELDHIVDYLKQYPHQRMKIVGHTDSSGPRRKNIELSKQRAKSVYEYIVSKGIDPRRLEQDGFGPDYPIHGNDTRFGRYENRRVDFVIIY